MYRWKRTNLATVLLAIVLSAGCATERTANKGEEAVSRGNWDAAVYHYLEALAGEPDNVEYKLQLARARQKAAQVHFQRGVALRRLGRLPMARDEFQMSVQLDPSNQYAADKLEDIVEELAVLSQPGGAAALAEMKARAREAKVQPPILDPRSDEPITLSFPKAKPIKEIYNAMAKAYGFNVLFDPKLKDDRLSIELTEVTAKQALEIVMQAGGHFYKVLDEGTIIVVEDTPQNRREYEDLVIKTFFLSNAEVKNIDKLLRSLIEARRLATNEQLNAITLRDTADKVAIAEKLIAINDKAKAEVLIDVELLLMATNSSSDIGVTLSTYAFNLQLDTAAINTGGGGDGTLGLDDFAKISRGDWFINVPSVLINLAKSSGNAEVLAQPQLRITEGEKASLHIGDRVPIPVTSFNTGNTIGGNVVPITSFQYQDIGIKIDVEPRVHHNEEVTLKLSLEVSNLGEEVPVGPNQSAVTIGTRTITSVIRLKSGESSLLAGLFRHDVAEGVTKTPLLSDIPLLGRLFTNKSVTHKTTDLVMTLTPHIIRFPDIEEEDLAPVWVGTESRISYFGSSSPRVHSGRSPRGPFDPKERPEGKTGGTRSRQPTRPNTSRPAPYGVGVRPAPSRQGSDLVPGRSGSDDKKSLGPAPGEEAYEEPPDAAPELLQPDTGLAPIVVALEPAVVSLHRDEQTVLQVVASGGSGGFRLPVDLAWDPSRLAVEDVELMPAVSLLEEGWHDEEGWLQLDLAVASGSELPQVLAVLRVRGLAPGPSPVMLSSSLAVAADGAELPVATNDGAVFVVEPEADDGAP